jgi:glycosyltransferase involved in cell wall biosynthesis
VEKVEETETQDMNTCAIMTVRNRLNLLERTVQSLVEAEVKPPHIQVFDDRSEDPDGIKRILQPVEHTYHLNEHQYGCDGNTPRAIAWTFANTDADVVVVMDSDLIFAPNWRKILDRLLEVITTDPLAIAGSLLHLDNVTAKRRSLKYTDLLECDMGGAAGMIVTRKFWTDFIKPFGDKAWFYWDAGSIAAAIACGFKFYTPVDSAVQHIGNNCGIHSGAGQVASSFRAELRPWYLMIHRTKEARDKQVIIISGKGWANVACACLARRILLDAGVGIRPQIYTGDEHWDALVNYVCADRESVYPEPIRINTPDGRLNVCTSQCREEFHRDFTFLNFEMDSDENAWIMNSLDNDPGRLVAEVLKFVLDLDSPTVLPWNALKIDVPSGSFVWGPRIDNTQVIVNAIEGDVADIPKKYLDDLCNKPIRYLVLRRPNGINYRVAREQYYFELKPMETLKSLSTASLFMSASNPSSFVAIFSKTPSMIFTSQEPKIRFPENL